MKHSIFAVILALVLPLAGLFSDSVRAADTKEPPILSITPAIQDRVMAPTEKEARFTVTVTNNSESPLTVAISTTDFTALNQTGGVAFLGEDASRPFQGHGLSSVLTPDLSRITLQPNSSKDVAVTAKDIPRLAPGGHYAAVIVKVVNGANSKTNNQLSNQQAVSSLVFLETAGQGTKTMNLISLPDQGTSFSLPSEVNLVFRATGNTQTVPRGVVTISRGDKEVMRGIINESSSLILPGSTRLLQTPLSGDNKPSQSGMYTLRVQYKYDGSLGITTYEQRFLYINVASLILPVLVVALIAVIAFKTRRLWLAFIAKLFTRFKPKRFTKRVKLNVVWAKLKSFGTRVLAAIAADIKKLQKEKPEYLPLPERSGARKKQVKK